LKDVDKLFKCHIVPMASHISAVAAVIAAVQAQEQAEPPK